MTDLFADAENTEPRIEPIAPGAVVLRHCALADEAALLEGLDEVTRRAPFRHMTTPGGFRMTVAITNCGELGWVTDRTGYRYERHDPESKSAWPPMPAVFRRLAARAAATAGFDGFVPDACLVNRYEPGAKLSLHRDSDERDFAQPIVSVSLGLPATFQFGGASRSDRTLRIPLAHGDVVVWGGPSRLRYHGVLPLKDGTRARLGRQRINLTFRKAG